MIKKRNVFSCILRLGIVILSVICGVLSADAADWKLYPAFDRDPMRIVDTPEQTYFLVYQQPFDKTKGCFGVPYTALFAYDKQNPEQGIRAFDNFPAPVNSTIVAADYSPAGGYLLIGYDDGRIDAVGKNFSKKITLLQNRNEPGYERINSFSFDSATGDAYVATDGCVVKIDALTFEASMAAEIGVPLTYVAHSAVGLLAVVNGKILILDRPRGSVEDFRTIPDVEDALVILPLTANCFAYVSGNYGWGNGVVIAEHDGNQWNRRYVDADAFTCRPESSAIRNRFEGNFIPNRDGYFIYSPQYACQISRPLEDQPAKGEWILRSQSESMVGSWDFTNFWVYRDRGTFVPRRAIRTNPSNPQQAEWTDTHAPIRPEAPAAFASNYMSYIPGLGMTVINHGLEWSQFYQGQMNPPLTSVLTAEGWKVCSNAYEVPASAASNPQLASLYQNNINRFPIADPAGLAFDSRYGNHIFCGSFFSGMMIQDLDDISKDPIHLASPADPLAGYPGFAADFPRQTWGSLCSVSNPSFDAEGNLWMAYANTFLHSSEPKQSKQQLRYIKSEDIAQLLSTPLDKIADRKWTGRIDIQTDEQMFWTAKALALKHERNRNRVLAIPNQGDRIITIVDHAGTLDDSSDDVQIQFRNIRSTRDGKNFSSMKFNDLVENPSTGEVIFVQTEDVVVFDPASETVDGAMPGETLRFKSGPREGERILKDGATKIIFDEYGRMWIATDMYGVIGVSADCSEIFAQYNISNSPLPSNCVYGLAWNPASQSLFISTDKGYAEVTPGAVSNVSAYSGASYLTPSVVSPDFHGKVELRNLPANSTVVIKDKDGKEVMSLQNGGSRDILWDTKDARGNLLPTGTYQVIFPDFTSEELIIVR